METEIEIHILKDGTNMITAIVAGRPIAMTMFEWQLFMEDMRRAIETHLTPRAVDLRESAASEGESTPEVNLVGGADTTPPANH